MLIQISTTYEGITVGVKKLDLDQVRLSKRLKSEGIENLMEAALEVRLREKFHRPQERRT